MVLTLIALKWSSNLLACAAIGCAVAAMVTSRPLSRRISREKERQALWEERWFQELEQEQERYSREEILEYDKRLLLKIGGEEALAEWEKAAGESGQFVSPLEFMEEMNDKKRLHLHGWGTARGILARCAGLRKRFR